MSSEKVKLLYIAGWDRSGSTLLDNILGQIEGFFSVGEFCDVWERGAEGLCGCGARFRKCDVWRAVFTEAFGIQADQFDFRSTSELRQKCERRRQLPMLVTSFGRRLIGRALPRYASKMEKLYCAVRNVTRARVIVDSSKRPTHGCILQTIPTLDLHVVHLVRDPRGCAFSYQRQKQDPDPSVGHMPQMGGIRNSLEWNLANASIEALWKRSKRRYLLIRYEDLVQKPLGAVWRILELLSERPVRLPFAGSRTLELRPLHGVSGNPVRFRCGVVDIVPDDEWKSRMKTGQKLVVTALTAPGLVHYGYGPFGGMNDDSSNPEKYRASDSHALSPGDGRTTTQP